MSIFKTNNTLDLAIEGNGFFEIILPDGNTVYTRHGSFERNNEGTLTTRGGFIIQPKIKIPTNATKIHIELDGKIKIETEDNFDDDAIEIGQLQLVDFKNTSSLKDVGEDYFIETPESGSPVSSFPFTNGLGSLHQGALNRKETL